MVGTRNTTAIWVIEVYYFDSNIFILPALYEGKRAKKEEEW